MARRGLSRTIRTQDPDLRDAIETLAADHDVMSSTVTTLIASATIPPGASIVAFAGGAGQTLTLPAANALGPSTGAVVMVMNVSGVPVTLVPSRGDTLNGGASLSLGAGLSTTLSSNGVSKWIAQTGGTMAKVWVSTPDPSVPNAVNMGALGSGVLMQSVSAGIATPAVFASGSGRIPFGSGSNGALTDEAGLNWDPVNKTLRVNQTAAIVNAVFALKNLAGVATYFQVDNDVPGRYSAFAFNNSTGNGTTFAQWGPSTAGVPANGFVLECLAGGPSNFHNSAATTIGCFFFNNTSPTAATNASSGAQFLFNRTLASAAGATWDNVLFDAATLTLTGATNVTTAAGLNAHTFKAPTINGGLTVNQASTVYIAGPPAGTATITNPYSLWVAAGSVRIDGAVALGGGAAATLGTIGGAGPTAAAQAKWIPLNSNGVQYWAPGFA